MGQLVPVWGGGCYIRGKKGPVSMAWVPGSRVWSKNRWGLGGCLGVAGLEGSEGRLQGVHRLLLKDVASEEECKCEDEHCGGS